MNRFVCVLWYVVMGIKYQTKGYSNESPMMADRDAYHKIVAMWDADNVPAEALITDSGREYYEWGNATCKSLWRNAQARSPWQYGWI